MIILKNKALFVCVYITLPVVFSPALAAEFDPGNSPGFYSSENWYATRNGGTPKFTSTEGGLSVTTLSDDAYLWGYMAPVTLEVGDSLSVSFTATFSASKSLGTFSFGIFNSGKLPQSDLDTLLAKNNISTHGINSKGQSDIFGVKPLTGTMNGIYATSAALYSRFAGTTDSGFMTTNAASYVQRSQTFQSALENPVIDVDYALSLEILRKENENTDFLYEVTLRMGDSKSESLNIANSQNVFDVIGLRSPGSSITLSDFSVATNGAVIPEPSHAITLMGIAALLGSGVARRRKS